MNSDLTLVPLEKKGGSVLSLMGFITPVVSASGGTTGPVRSNASNGAGQANPHTKIIGLGANEKNQTLLDRFRVLIKDTRFFDVGKLKAYKIGKEFRIEKAEFERFMNKAKTK